MATEDFHSQARQDEFVSRAIPGLAGVFVDIGAGHPREGSNTAWLEDIRGWSGILCDIQHSISLMRSRGRCNTVFGDANTVFGDAFTVDWRKECHRVARDGWIDYLSLDLEPPSRTLSILAELPLDSVKFKVATIEHDLYRGNHSIRLAMRGIMFGYGYELVAEDVCCVVGEKALPFEDWWAHPAHADAARAAVAEMKPVRLEDFADATRQAKG